MTAPSEIGPSATATEQRKAARPRVLLSGKIVYLDGGISTDCTIRDQTPSGARVRMSGTLALPAEVYLIELKSGVAFECRVAWRRLPDVGLQFISSQKLSESDDPRLRRLKRIWVEHLAR